MLNNWMFGREPDRIYSPLLSLDPLACRDGIRSQACGLMSAELSISSAQEWPVSFPKRAVFASGLQYLLDCYLWWLKVQIGLVGKGSHPTHSLQQQCTPALRLRASFYLWMFWRSFTWIFFQLFFFPARSINPNVSLFFFFFLISPALFSATENRRLIEGENTFRAPFLQSPRQGQ